MKRKILMMTSVLTAVFGQYMPTLSTPKAINNQYPTVKVSIEANYKPVTGSLNPPPVNSPYAPNVVQQSIIKRPPYVAKPVKEGYRRLFQINILESIINTIPFPNQCASVVNRVSTSLTFRLFETANGSFRKPAMLTVWTSFSLVKATLIEVRP